MKSSPDVFTMRPPLPPVASSRARAAPSPVEQARRVAWGKAWGAVTRQAAIDARRETG